MFPTQHIYSTPVNYDKWSEPHVDTHQFFQSYSPDFQPALDFLMQDAALVETLKEIVDIQGEKIHLKFGLQVQPASYDFDTNTITLSKSYRQSSLQEQVAFLFFELQNARQCQDLQYLHSQAEALGKEEFVKQIEQHEYHSALATHNYVHKYVNKGIFSKAVPYFYIPLNFKDHYLLQQLTGHAQDIAARVDRFMHTQNKKEYRGTWPCPLTPIQVPVLKLMLSYKTVLQTPKKETTKEMRGEAKQGIIKLMSEIDSIYTSNPKVSGALWRNAHAIYPISSEKELPIAY